MPCKEMNEIRKINSLFKKERYHMNPVMAGFVASPEDWKYSSALNFCGSDNYRMKELVELKFSS